MALPPRLDYSPPSSPRSSHPHGRRCSTGWCTLLWRVLLGAAVLFILLEYIYVSSTRSVGLLRSVESEGDPGKVKRNNASGEKKPGEIDATYAVSAISLNTTGAIPNAQLTPNPDTRESGESELAKTKESGGPEEPSLPLCPMSPPVLVGPIKVWFDTPSFSELEKLYPRLEPGGHSKPESCVSRHKVAIIIPYRAREEQLRVFLHNYHSLLRKQQLDYAIYVVEQAGDDIFNRAKLMNIGFVEALKDYDWQCFIFHDVDLMAEDDRNLYTCPEQPRHMSVAVDRLNYKLPYNTIFGGITALTKEQYEKTNGMSNSFWGWGGEDDEMSSRVGHAGFKASRYSADIARYKMIRHTHESTNSVNECRYKLMYAVQKRYKVDGLSSLDYEVVEKELKKLYSWVKVDLKVQESLRKLDQEGICPKKYGA